MEIYLGEMGIQDPLQQLSNDLQEANAAVVAACTLWNKDNNM